MDFYVPWIGNWDALGPSRLGYLLVVGSQRNTNTGSILSGDCSRRSILREETKTDKVVSPKLMQYDSTYSVDFFHSYWTTFLCIKSIRLRVRGKTVSYYSNSPKAQDEHVSNT